MRTGGGVLAAPDAAGDDRGVRDDQRHDDRGEREDTLEACTQGEECLVSTQGALSNLHFLDDS